MKKHLMRGIRIFQTAQRPGKWLVQWHPKIEGKRTTKTQTFASKNSATEFAAELCRKAKEHGRRTLNFQPEQWQGIQLFLKRIGEDTDLNAVADVWERHIERQTPWTLERAISQHLERRTETGKEASQRHVKARLKRTLDFFGNVRLHEIETEQIRRFLTVLRNSGEHGDWSISNHIRTLKAFFRRAKIEGWTKDNPVEAIENINILPLEISVISIADARKLFAYVRDKPISPRLALETFGGLRYASTAKMKFEEINWEERGIELPASKHKTRKRHFHEKMPGNAWQWLEAWRTDPRPWKMTPRQCLSAKSEAFTGAGVPHPQNILRHSFASYHVALFRDAAETATLLQHKNPELLFKHYKGRATASDAEAFFSIVP